VGVLGYGGGVIGRYSDVASSSQGCALSHPRVNQPAGWFYTSEALRTISDIWSVTARPDNMHGSTGDIILLALRQIISKQLSRNLPRRIRSRRLRLGGTHAFLLRGNGPLRVGMLRRMKLCYDLTMAYQDELHRCAALQIQDQVRRVSNDCVAAIARADLSVIGTWKDDIRIDQTEVANYAAAGIDIQKDICANCPTKCMDWMAKSSASKTVTACAACTASTLCPRRCGRRGEGAVILIGAKAPILQGALLSSVLIPFVAADELLDTLRS